MTAPQISYRSEEAGLVTHVRTHGFSAAKLGPMGACEKATLRSAGHTGLRLFYPSYRFAIEVPTKHLPGKTPAQIVLVSIRRAA